MGYEPPSKRELVWYASYGSNLAYEKRFLCYIRGGTPAGSKQSSPGCRNTSPPLQARPITLKCELYFAGHFEGWDGAAAFIRRAPAGKVLGRMYLITDEQFNDVVLQENGRKVDGRRLVPAWETFAHRHEFVLPVTRSYNRLLVVGNASGFPIVTFTVAASNPLTVRPPSEPYVKIIAAGIKETYPSMEAGEIVAYLSRAEGIKDRIPPDQLTKWVVDSVRREP